jgi:hypothetical protein
METRSTLSSRVDGATCTALPANDGEEIAIVEATISVELRLCFLAITERMLTDFQARLFMGDISLVYVEPKKQNICPKPTPVTYVHHRILRRFESHDHFPIFPLRFMPKTFSIFASTTWFGMAFLFSYSWTTWDLSLICLARSTWLIFFCSCAFCIACLTFDETWSNDAGSPASSSLLVGIDVRLPDCLHLSPGM